ncbi:P-loop containing nucleoside triphosphate hydrolase protein [Xylariales sp. PMI_506]|nr:P-loop containing nucleoside triphosphate hydrolase protein [Xylariales sp. PMI_506]
MSRFVDTLPAPANPKEMKVVVLAFSRSGTLSVHKALNMLGFKSYHTVVVLERGVTDLKLFQEAARASAFGVTETYSRADFDKWFGEFDALVEMPGFFPEEIYKAYPNAKYILVERNPDKWVTSMKNTIGALAGDIPKFPLSYFRKFDEFIDEFFKFTWVFIDVITHTTGLNDAGWTRARQHYVDYITTCKKLVPPEQLKCVVLEEGLGWEEICPFLGLPIPEEEYPRGNDPLEFKGIVEDCLAPGIKKALFSTGAALVGTLSIGAWYFLSLRK